MSASPKYKAKYKAKYKTKSKALNLEAAVLGVHSVCARSRAGARTGGTAGARAGGRRSFSV